MSRDGEAKQGRQMAPPRLAQGPLRELKNLLHVLYLQAGKPTAKEIAAFTDVLAEQGQLVFALSKDTVWRCLTAPKLPPNPEDPAALAFALARMAQMDADEVQQRIRRLWTDERLHPTPSLRSVSYWDPVTEPSIRSLRSGLQGQGTA